MTIKEVIKMLLDEGQNPSITCITAGVVVSHVPATGLERHQEMLRKSIFEDALNTQQSAEMVLTYAIHVMKVGTLIKQGSFSLPNTSGEDLRKINDALSMHLRRAGIQPVPGATWRVSGPQIHFGDIANVSAVRFSFEDTDGKRFMAIKRINALAWTSIPWRNTEYDELYMTQLTALT